MPTRARAERIFALFVRGVFSPFAAARGVFSPFASPDPFSRSISSNEEGEESQSIGDGGASEPFLCGVEAREWGEMGRVGVGVGERWRGRG